MNMDNIFLLIIICIILGIIGWGSLLLSCYKETNNDNEEKLLDI
jgi:hypothetical protein